LSETKSGAGLTARSRISLALNPGYARYVETGQKLVDVVEMMEWAEAIGFDAGEIIKRLARVPRK
jgi:hypothetical protein